MNASFYNEIKEILISARNKVYQTANFAMVEAYWNIGKSIIEEQGGNEKAEYGTGVLKELAKQMTQEFGKGFTVANLKNILKQESCAKCVSSIMHFQFGTHCVPN